VAITAFYSDILFFVDKTPEKASKATSGYVEFHKAWRYGRNSWGIYGTVKDIKDDSFILEISDGVKIRILKSAISYTVKKSGSEVTEAAAGER